MLERFMLKFSPNEVPYRYDYEDPDTGVRFVKRTKQELIQHIINYRAQNRLPVIEHLNLTLEDYWCRQKENRSKCVPVKLNRGWLATLRGALHVVENIFFGDENMVAQEEADRRAAICVQCPHNVFPDKGPFIAWSDSVAEASTGGRKSASHDMLGNCAVCSCPLRAKVFAKDVTPTDQERQELPDFCWQLDNDL